jgi:hypothetical protein
MKNIRPDTYGQPTGTGRAYIEGTSMDPEELLQISSAYQQFSLHAMAERKQKQLGASLKSIPVSDIFFDSVILSKEDAAVSCCFCGLSNASAFNHPSS